MRKPDFEKVLKQDVEGSPSWFSQVLEPLNRLFEYISEAFRGNISTENLKVQLITYPFSTPFIRTSFQKTRKGNVVALFISQIRTSGGGPQGGGTSMDWFDNGDEIVVEGLYSIGVGSFIIKFMAFYE